MQSIEEEKKTEKIWFQSGQSKEHTLTVAVRTWEASLDVQDPTTNLL